MDSTKHLHFLRQMAEWLDTRFKGPWGTRFGLDPLIGLIPIVGDLVTLFLSVYILFNAYLLGCSFSIFFRMLLNILIDFVVKLIPFVGPIFDFIWKANSKNIQLLEAHLADPAGTHKKSQIILISVMIILVVFVCFCLTLTYYAFQLFKYLVFTFYHHLA